MFEPLPDDDPKVRRPVLDRAREVLGFRPQVKLREGLLRTIEYFADEMERDDERLRRHHRTTRRDSATIG